MTMNSSHKFPRTRSSRPPERLSVRASKSAAFGSSSTRPPTSPAPAGTVAKGAGLRASNGKTTPAIDEELWFGAAHDHAVAEDAAARSMAALVGRIIGAKPFPMTARRLADLTRQDVVRIEPVIQVLESDPGLSARLLRLVNSAGYALRQRCTSVRHAATLVGTDRLHQIATTAAVLNMFDSKGPVAAQIIEHSTVVGAFCRYLGAHLALPVDDLFTAGFLHDIGKLMLMETESEQYVELLTKCSAKPDTVHHLERALYGFDHAVLAAHVLSAWNIPDPVPKIVAWHHEPSHAYKASSMMAALVQTVRLADALVYVMQAEPELQNIKELAQHESASYLDISEPQLAAMWDELQVLYKESREQCLGENAPALDPRSLRPKKPIAASVVDELTPSERAHDLPKQFPCVECGRPTYGNTCPACGGYVCPDHQVGRDAWCALCARDFRAEKQSTPVPAQAKWVFGVLTAAVAISGVAGMISSGGAGAVRAGVGTLLLGSLVTVLYVIGKQWFIRSQFMRTRPNRFIAEPLLNDGGTQSLVPPEMPDSQRKIPHSASAILQANVRLIEPLKEIAIREISDHDYSISASSRGQSVADRGISPDDLMRSESSMVDSNRVRLQSSSLVTLPAPASPSETGSGPPGESAARSSSGSRRDPHDTLSERETASSGAGTGFDDDIESPPETAPVPPRIHDPELPKHGANSDDDRVRDTLCGPEFQRMSAEGTLLSSVQVPAALESAPREPSIVQPMPTIEIVNVPVSVAKTPGSHSGPENVQPTGVAEQAMAARSEAPARIISVHPLAALGFASEMPPTAWPFDHSSASPESSATGDHESKSDASSEFADPVTSPADAQGLSASTEAGPPTASAETTNPEFKDAKSKTQRQFDDVIESLIERSAVQFGEEFEARISELVAQRVAELVAERMLRAFGAATPTAGTRVSEKRRVSLENSPSGPVKEDRTANRTRQKKPRRIKNTQPRKNDVQDAKQK